MDKIIMQAGYTLEVTSWENDGDNYQTKRLHCKSLEEINAIEKMCKEIFVSCNNGDGGIGNTYDDTDTANYTIIHYLISNPELLDINGAVGLASYQDTVTEFFKEEQDFKINEWKDWLIDYIESNDGDFEEWIDLVMHYNYQLLGGSESYYSRVYESSNIYFTEQDLKCEIIKSKSIKAAF